MNPGSSSHEGATSTPSTDALAGAALAGISTDELSSLFQQYGPVLWRTLFAYTGGNGGIADDAVAEAFTRAVEHRAAIRDPLPWIYRTAFRIAAKESKRRASVVELPESIPADVEPGRLPDVMRAIRRLSPSQRAAVVLHYQADLPVVEVATLMGSSVAAVKVHLFRARRRLRELLGTEEVEDD